MASIAKALIEILSYPWNMLRAVLVNIVVETGYIHRVIAAGRSVGLGMVWDQLKWILLLLLLGLFVAWLIKITLTGVWNTERQRQRGWFFELLVVSLSLFIYYFLIALGFYVLLNVIIPIAREL